ncbi:hypothetical protein WJX72_004503 [[Myrmecia] bisecta]|uniref:Uncharacterized protein n=1 Tax=[Myrmecia] bisecta TaxID=41462 RepID=A0AAW1R6I2_9CHLO
MAEIPELSSNQQDRFFSYLDASAACSFLAESLQLPNHTTDARSAIQVDYAASVLRFARQTGLSHLQTTLIYSIAWQVLRQAQGDPASPVNTSIEDQQAVESKLRASCRDLLMPLATPEEKVAQAAGLSVQQIGQVAHFFKSTLIRHLSLYRYAFTRQQGHDLHTADLLVETPWVQPFLGALDAEAWAAYNADNAARAAAEALAAEEARQAQQAAEAAAEAQRVLAAAEEARQAQLARVPQTLDEAIEHAVAVRVEAEKKRLQEEYAASEQGLLSKIAELEGKLKTGAAASAAKK